MSAASAFLDDTTQAGNVVGQGRHAGADGAGRQEGRGLPEGGGGKPFRYHRDRAYVADPDQLAKYADLRKQYFGSGSPARTIVKKGALSHPENLVEVMAFAAIP